MLGNKEKCYSNLKHESIRVCLGVYIQKQNLGRKSKFIHYFVFED